MSLIKIKQANFYYVVDNRINTFINNISGYGIVTTSGNEFVTGEILDPTGFQPAVFYKTGTLIGEINAGSGFFNWEDLELSGTGEQNFVYLNYETGQKQASNVIEFIDNTGSGLFDGDIINMAGFSFIFQPSGTPPSNFRSPSELINILNSGATGGYNDLGFTILESIVGITGYQNDNKLFLFSYLRSGETGNNIRIYRDSANLNAIKIPNRYFTGGATFRRQTNEWNGDFTNIFDLNIEKSGFYTIKTEELEIFKNISGVAWEDNFDKNYTILTGIVDPRDPESYSPNQVFFNSSLNLYSGRGLIPSGSSRLYTGINIEIYKPNPYNISGNISKYIFSGSDFIFSGLIEG